MVCIFFDNILSLSIQKKRSAEEADMEEQEEEQPKSKKVKKED
jgi:hypothetical protein